MNSNHSNHCKSLPTMILVIGVFGMWSFPSTANTTIAAEVSSVLLFGGGTSVATPLDLSNLGGKLPTHVSAGSSHALILTADGTVFAWGTNIDGRTGLGLTTG